MIKKNKGKLIISSVIILLPTLAGLILWNKLPGWSNRPFTVFFGPCLILALHWLCMFGTSFDPRNRDQSRKVFGAIFWICPVISVMVSAMSYMTALGRTFGDGEFTLIFIGLTFAIIGNNMPKCKQNSTIGIKIKWTLKNEENWNKTHRFAGKIWVIVGFVMMAAALLPVNVAIYVILPMMILAAFIPMAYSYRYYKKQVAAGTWVEDYQYFEGVQFPEKAKKISIVIVAVILVGTTVLMFTGNIEMEYGETAFVIESSYWSGLMINYDEIDSIEYRTERVPGTRVGGWGSPRLLMGAFSNDEFGAYTRYTYTKCDEAVILTVGERVFVISGEDTAATQAIYDELAARTGK